MKSDNFLLHRPIEILYFYVMDNIKHHIAPVAAHVIEKAGGVPIVARICGRSEVSVYKWKWSKAKGGTGGLIPTECAQKLMSAAGRGEVNLVPEDFFEITGDGAA